LKTKPIHVTLRLPSSLTPHRTSPTLGRISTGSSRPLCRDSRITSITISRRADPRQLRSPVSALLPQFVEYTVEDGHLFFLEVDPPSVPSHLPSPQPLQTNTVKSNPHFSRGGAYLVDIQSGIDLPEDSAESQYQLLEASEVTDPVSVNPLFLGKAEPSS
jgi:hypothetical protein